MNITTESDESHHNGLNRVKQFKKNIEKSQNNISYLNLTSQKKNPERIFFIKKIHKESTNLR